MPKQTPDEAEKAYFMRLGKQQLLPGYRTLRERVIAFMDSEIEKLLEDGPRVYVKRSEKALAAAVADLEKHVGKTGDQRSAQQGYWDRMTPEQRSVEIARRMKKGKENHGKTPQEMAGAAMKKKAKAKAKKAKAKIDPPISSKDGTQPAARPR